MAGTNTIPCPLLTDPNNGVMICSLGDDGVPSYEDTCSFTCNTGYELTGSDTRNCQSDGSWSGSDTLCNQMEGSDSAGSSGSSGAVIGGSVGGVVIIIVIIIVVLLVLIYMRQLHQKKSYPVKAGITNTISDGGTNSTEKKNEEQYSEIMLPQLHHDDTIKMDSNPSYGSYTGQGSNIAIRPNPSYGVNKPNNKISEDQYDYAQPTELTNHPLHDDREGDVNMESNPSYGVIRGEGSSNMGCDVTIEPNPSYGVATRMGTNTKTTPGSDVTITPNPAYGCVKAKK